MAEKKQIVLHRAPGAGAPRKRGPKLQQRSSLMPLWIILAILLIGGTSIVATIKGNKRKSAAKALALTKQRTQAADLCERISTTTKAVQELGNDVELLRARTTERVDAVLKECPAPEKGTEAKSARDPYSKRPQLKTDTEKLTSLKDELAECLQTVDGAVLASQDVMELAHRDQREVVHTRDHMRAGKTLSELETMLPRAEELLKKATEAHRVASLVATDILTLADAIVENERLRKEDEEKARAAEKLARQTQEDKARADRQKVEFLKMTARFDMEAALDRLKAEADQYLTESGRQRHGLLLEQCSELIAMKSEVVRQLAAKPFSWGWTQDGARRDIDSATAEYLKVGPRSIPWQDVTQKQMTSILSEYICGPGVRPSTHSDFCIGAALYFSANGRDDIASAVLEKGTSMRASTSKRAKRLAPTITF
ncbi:MAG: hypothetical protein HN341_17250 [Verrucomicrobia bacterium]|jgi:hypothetical protein|nr:hypothetical protein [Verrucomicrobiota bacterium]